MTLQEILENGRWETENQFVIYLAPNFLRRKIRFEIDFEKADIDNQLSSSCIKAINDFLNLKQSDWDWIREELFKASQDAYSQTGYGFEVASQKENQSQLEANQDLFQIYSIDDAFEKSNLRSVSTAGDLSYSFFYMVFDVPWDIEHSVNFSFIEGQKKYIE